MRILVLVSLVFCFAFCGCEDKKKTSEEKAETAKEIKKDSIKAEAVSEEIKTEIEATYPKITDDNVVEFLTQYGVDNPETKVRITTYLGVIEMQLFEDTPLHRANFIFLIKRRYFENTFFHRIAPGFIIQGGNSDLRSTPKKRAEIGKSYRLPAEITAKSTHKYGSLCGAKEYRKNPDKKSEPFEFYIFIGEPRQANHLNGDYTIFGKVTKGMDIVEIIAKQPADEGEWPKQNIYISAEVLD